MSSRIIPRRTTYFLLHHGRTITEPLVERLIREHGPVAHMATPALAMRRGEVISEESPEWEGQAKRMIAAARRDELTGLSWSFPLQRERGIDSSSIHVTLKCKPFEMHSDRGIERVDLGGVNADGDHWAMARGTDFVEWWNAAHMDWFLEKCRPLVEFFEADFACAGVEEAVFRNLKDGTDPRALAWPLMVLGGEEVKRLGRDHLLESPAWKVEELPYGGIWIQASENPFDCPKSAVSRLATHLGLEARR